MSKKQLSIEDFIKTPLTPNKLVQNPTTHRELSVSLRKQPAFASVNKFTVLEGQPSSSKPKPNNFKEAVTTTSQNTTIQRTSTNFERFAYFLKPQARPVTIIEPELNPEILDSLNPKLEKIINIVFRKGELWLNTDHRKTKDFYELILLDSQSAEILHNYDEKDKNVISHSRFKILKILTLQDWGQNPNTGKNFSILYTPSGYNYYDYIDAWYFVFFVRSFNHSWFFLFKRNAELSCPHWFNDWWEDYGLCKEIMPPTYHDGFTLFKTRMKNLNMNPIIAYVATFGIPWIMAWKFTTTPGVGKLIWLARQFSVKWWHQIREGQGDLQGVKQFFADKSTIHAEISSSAGQFNFLTDKSKLISSLSEKGSKRELKQALEEALSKVSSQDESDEDDDDTIAISGYTPENEDGCFNQYDL